MSPETKKLNTSAIAEADLIAEVFVDKLTSLARYPGDPKISKDNNKSGKSLHVRMLNIFGLAKQFTKMPLVEVEKLLDSDYYEVRMGAVSIMDFQARDKKISPERRKELYNLYIKRHDRINDWGMVDRSAPYVVGGYLFDKARTPLFKLAKSKNIWERRTAIVSTYYFIRQNDIEDTFRIAEMLIHDKEDLINKAVGSWIREAGKKDNDRLMTFLNKYAATMPRVTLRYSIEKLDAQQKRIFMNATT